MRETQRLRRAARACTPLRSVGAVALIIFTSACVPRAKPPPPLPPLQSPTPVLEEQDIKAVDRPNVVITDVHETPSADAKTVTVIGTLVNRGAGNTREVSVYVEALDQHGVVLMSLTADPTPRIIPPAGTGAFAVTFTNRPDVDRYHVEVISR